MGPTALSEGEGHLRWDAATQPDYHDQDLLEHEQLLQSFAVVASVPARRRPKAVLDLAHRLGILGDHEAGAEPLALWLATASMVRALLRLREPLLANGRVMEAEVEALEDAVVQFNAAAELDPAGPEAIPRPHVRSDNDVVDGMVVPDAHLGFGEPSPARMFGRIMLPPARWAAAITATGVVAEIANLLMERGGVRVQVNWAEAQQPAKAYFEATNLTGVLGLALGQSLSALQVRCQGCQRPFERGNGNQTWCDGPECGKKGAARKRKQAQRDRELRERFN